MTLVRLIGIDVDGTLVGSTGIVAPAVWQGAASARAAGIHLALCTGRPAFGLALEHARGLDPNGWHIFQNGASIVHLGTKESRSVPLPAGVVQQLIAQARATGQVLELYGDSDYVIESEHPWARQHAELLGVPFQLRRFEDFTQTIVRAQWVVSPEVAARLPTHEHGLEIAISSAPQMTQARFVGLTREGVSKGSAMTAIAAAYDVAIGDVMYVGDSGNDLSALRIVGHPLAMGNAEPEVIAAAQRTIGHVDVGGLADAFQIALGA